MTDPDKGAHVVTINLRDWYPEATAEELKAIAQAMSRDNRIAEAGRQSIRKIVDVYLEELIRRGDPK